MHVAPQHPAAESDDVLPAIVAKAGDRTSRSFIKLFIAAIRNKSTRAAYARPSVRFLDWCDALGLRLHRIEPVVVAAYIERRPGSRSAVKQRLAAFRTLFDWFVREQVLPVNPATPVRGPTHAVRRGKDTCAHR